MRKMQKKWIALFLAVITCCNLIYPLSVRAEESKIETMLNTMSLRQKITQMLMIDFRKWDMDLEDEQRAVDFVEMNEQVQDVLKTYNFGALVYFANNIKNTEQAYNLTMDIQKTVVQSEGIPMLIGADQEGGSVYRLGSGTALPGNMALGAAWEECYSERAGKIVGSELNAVGINMNLAPVVDVNNNANNPVIGLRSYGDDAEAVGKLSSAFIQGMNTYNVIGCVKHFPGHGDTDTDSHYGLPCVDKSKEVLMENELKPYTVVIENGIEMIMTAHILYPELDSSKIYSEKTGAYESVPATMSKTIITDLLKDEMGFDGIVITDSMRMDAISESWDSVQAVINAINAGIDMICMPCVLYDLDDFEELDKIIDGVINAVESGAIEETRINDAVERILRVKEKRGILDYNENEYTLENAKLVVGSDENRQNEREIASAAVTVVKNENNILPLEITSESKVLLLCPYNNERAQLVMGWNRAQSAGLIPNGASMDYYRYSNATITDTLKEKIDWADTIIVISEVSSAARMAYQDWRSEGPNNFANYAKENGKKSIIMSADKPYDIQLYPNSDAIIAVYGCKGSTIDPTEVMNGGIEGSELAYGPNIIAGVEVILGVFGATGKLPVNVPEFDIETGTYTTKIIYPRGYGLTYNSLIKEKISKVELKQDNFIYDGTEKEPELVIYAEKGEILVRDVDYTVDYVNNINAGTATAIITGIGNYEGRLLQNYSIEKAAQEVNITLENKVLKVGESIAILVEQKVGDGEISFTVSNDEIATVDSSGIVTGISEGEALIKVHVSETSNYKLLSEEISIEVEPAKQKIGNVKLQQTQFTYDGDAKEPNVKVLSESSEILVEGIDYQIVYENNVNAGTATITVTGIGDYVGIITETFEIEKAEQVFTADLTNLSIAIGAIDTVKVNTTKGDGKVSYSVDDTSIATVEDNGVVTGIAAGEAVITITFAETDNYKETSKKINVTVKVGQPVIKLSNIKATGKIKIFWKDIEGAVKYQVYRSTSKNGTYKRLGTTTKLSYINSSAISGKAYYYKVRAIDVSGNVSAYSSIKCRTCDLARPEIKIGNVASTGKIKLIWNEVAGATKYEIYRATTENGTYKKCYTTTKTSFVNTSVAAGKAYYYKVRAICDNSAASSAYSVAKYRTCDLARPVVTASSTTARKIKLTWNKVSGADEYQVYRSTSKDGTYTLIKTTTNTSFTNTKLKSGKTYYYKVKAINTDNSASNSAYSTVIYKKAK